MAREGVLIMRSPNKVGHITCRPPPTTSEERCDFLKCGCNGPIPSNFSAKSEILEINSWLYCRIVPKTKTRLPHLTAAFCTVSENRSAGCGGYAWMIQAAGRAVRTSACANAATARRLAMKALRCNPRSQGILVWQFSASFRTDCIQRGVFVMGLFLMVCLLARWGQCRGASGQELDADKEIKNFLQIPMGLMWPALFGCPKRPNALFHGNCEQSGRLYLHCFRSAVG